MALGLSLSLGIGLALGLFGGGGSILAVPILTYVLGVPPQAAIAASLLIVGVTSAVALVAHVRSGSVVFRAGIPFGGAAMLGAYAGGSVARFVPDALLLLGFGVMMFGTAAAMLRDRSLTRHHEPLATARLNIVVYGVGVGAIAGLVGAGGGFLIVPTLVLRGGMSMTRAIPTSLLVISMQSWAGFVGHFGHAAVPGHIVVPVAALAALGSVAGGMLGKKFRPESLRRGFAWLAIAVALYVVGGQLPALSNAR